MSDDVQEPDRAPGAPHPRDAMSVIGHRAAEQTFLDAFNSGRMHHAWLITGPRGVGKATLAWRLARFLLATPVDDGGMFGAPEPPTTLDTAPDHPVNARILALSEPCLCLIRRPWDAKSERLRAEITVDEVRKLKRFFGLSATDGGRRVVIVDAADEMNVNAANALLKVLEEPPANTVLFLISHQPTRLLPTIRSRCRALRCAPLSDAEMAEVFRRTDAPDIDNPAAIAALAAGSPGAALRLLAMDGLEIYGNLVGLLQKGLNRPTAVKFAEGCAGPANVQKFDLVLELIDLFLSRLARAGVSGPPDPEAAEGEAVLFAHLNPGPLTAQRWASLQQDLSHRTRHGQAVNLDPAALILDTLFKINETAARLAA